MTIAAAAQIWLNESVAGRKAEKATRNHAYQLGGWIDGKTLDEIPSVATTYAKKQKGFLAAATINRRLCVLKAVAKFSFLKGWIGENLSSRIQTLPEHNLREIYLSREEIKRLVDACDNPAGKAWIMIAAYTGMRQGEIMALTPKDIVDGTIIIRDSKIGTPRVIPVVPKLATYLRFVPFILHARTYYAMFEDARDKAGFVGLTYHSLRHTTASLLINSGVDLYTIGKILGHKSAQTTKRYAHLDIKRLKSAMKKLA